MKGQIESKLTLGRNDITVASSRGNNKKRCLPTHSHHHWTGNKTTTKRKKSNDPGPTCFLLIFRPATTPSRLIPQYTVPHLPLFRKAHSDLKDMNTSSQIGVAVFSSLTRYILAYTIGDNNESVTMQPKSRACVSSLHEFLWRSLHASSPCSANVPRKMSRYEVKKQGGQTVCFSKTVRANSEITFFTCPFYFPMLDNVIFSFSFRKSCVQCTRACSCGETVPESITT